MSTKFVINRKVMKPIHKFNNGQGATLCHQCNCIASLGHTEDLYCNECNKHTELDEKGNPLTYWGGLKEPKQESCCTPIGQIKRYYVLMEYEPSWMWTITHTSDGDELDWSIVNYNLKEVSPRVEIAEEDIAKEQKKMYSEEDMRKAFKSSSLTNMLDVYESFEEFIEQFKNK
jgi:hypothetical protein